MDPNKAKVKEFTEFYSKIKEVEVIAIADSIQSRLDGSSKAEGNISGQAEGGVTGLSVIKYLLII